MLNLQPVPFDPDYIDPVFGLVMVILMWSLCAIVFRTTLIEKADRWAARRRQKRRDRHYANLVSDLATPDFPSYPKESKWE